MSEPRLRIGVRKWNLLRDLIESRIGLSDHMLKYPKNTALDIARHEGEKAGLTKALSYMEEVEATKEEK